VVQAAACDAYVPTVTWVTLAPKSVTLEYA
jgi:hypothetical protein